jgi:uncharacterized integral membrane protein
VIPVRETIAGRHVRHIVPESDGWDHRTFSRHARQCLRRLVDGLGHTRVSIGKAAVVMTAAHDHRETSTPNNGPASHDDSARPTPVRPAVPRSRAGGLWVAAVVFALVLLLLLIFVLQNGQRVDVSFLGAHGQLPLGVALLLAAVFGVLLVALPGTARIVQLRMLGHRRDRASATGPLPLPSDGPAGRQTGR